MHRVGNKHKLCEDFRAIGLQGRRLPSRYQYAYIMTQKPAYLDYDVPR